MPQLFGYCGRAMQNHLLVSITFRCAISCWVIYRFRGMRALRVSGSKCWSSSRCMLASSRSLLTSSVASAGISSPFSSSCFAFLTAPFFVLSFLPALVSYLNALVKSNTIASLLEPFFSSSCTAGFVTTSDYYPVFSPFVGLAPNTSYIMESVFSAESSI